TCPACPEMHIQFAPAQGRIGSQHVEQAARDCPRISPAEITDYGAAQAQNRRGQATGNDDDVPGRSATG
ncbi:MAG TPA: hypothetical protein VGI28_08440, partial [Stellaceae bacterium]